MGVEYYLVFTSKSSGEVLQIKVEFIITCSCIFIFNPRMQPIECINSYNQPKEDICIVLLHGLFESSEQFTYL